jgi:hypothetical protein
MWGGAGGRGMGVITLASHPPVFMQTNTGSHLVSPQLTATSYTFSVIPLLPLIAFGFFFSSLRFSSTLSPESVVINDFYAKTGDGEGDEQNLTQLAAFIL